MVVLHGAWLDGRGLLWAEATPGDGRVTGAHARADQPPWSPYDAGADGLRAALASFNAGIAPERLDHTCCRIAWLPTVDGTPLPSRAFLLGVTIGKPGAHARPVTAPWRVTALPLEWDEYYTLLGALVGGPRLARGVIAGVDLLRWADVLRYAGALVARRLFLPGIRRRADGAYESIWQPALEMAERARLLALAKRLPAAAVGLTEEEVTSAPQPCSSRAVEAFIEEAIDRFVRFSGTTRLSRAHAEHGHYFSVHDAWIASLRGEGSRGIRWDVPEELAALSTEVALWRRPVDLGARAPYRVCFRLEEPDDDRADGWVLRYLVESLGAEPCEATPLSVIWHRNTLDAEAREGLLVALGQAAGLCPAIGTNPLEQMADGCELSTAEAHRFLCSQAVLLEAAGFGVQVPAWWTADERRPRVELVAQVAPAEPAASTVFTLGALVSVNWDIALGGERVTVPELEALAAAGEALVRFRGRWIEVDHARVSEALRLWKRNRTEARAANDIVRFMLGVDSDAHGIDVAGVVGSGWIGELLQRLRGETALEQPSPPAGFVGELRPYQHRGHAWLAFLRQWGLGACLADDMGLGKTVQALVHIERQREQGEKRPVLLVCPTSVLTNWARESARFVPGLSFMVHHGPDRCMGDSFVAEAGRHAVVATCYALLYRDYAWLRRVKWSGIVLDEAQNIKNADTRQSQAARALQSDYRIALTGTPVENHVGDLWSIMDFLNPGLLGTRAAFRDRYSRPIQAGTDPHAREALRRRTAPFILRRLKTDRDVVPDLPEKREARVFCPLTREQAGLYEAVVRDLAASVRDTSGITRKGRVLAALTHLKQVCNHPAHFLGDGSALSDRSGKLIRLSEMLAEVVDEGAAALVFTQYAAMGALIQQHLQQEIGCAVPFLYGGSSRAARDEMVAAFQRADGPPVLVLSLKAGGTGLNLTRASHVFHYDRWWNPAVENQATDRAFRIGQTRDVMVHKFICAGTLEERIDAMIESKTALAVEIIASGEAWLTELNDDQLYDVLALSQEAVEEDV
jgi:superfamily II DNA or RNA helicase